MVLKNIVDAVYAAKRTIVRKEAEIYSAIRRGDREAAAALQTEIKQLRSSVLREHKIIL